MNAIELKNKLQEMTKKHNRYDAVFYSAKEVI